MIVAIVKRFIYCYIFLKRQRVNSLRGAVGQTRRKGAVHSESAGPPTKYPQAIMLSTVR
jgi:hypothetical protein